MDLRDHNRQVSQREWMEILCLTEKKLISQAAENKHNPRYAKALKLRGIKK